MDPDSQHHIELSRVQARFDDEFEVMGATSSSSTNNGMPPKPSLK